MPPFPPAPSAAPAKALYRATSWQWASWSGARCPQSASGPGPALSAAFALPTGWRLKSVQAAVPQRKGLIHRRPFLDPVLPEQRPASLKSAASDAAPKSSSRSPILLLPEAQRLQYTKLLLSSRSRSFPAVPNVIDSPDHAIPLQFTAQAGNRYRQGIFLHKFRSIGPDIGE